MAVMGRPELYNEELADFVCDEVARGRSIIKISKDPGMPSHPTIYSWLQKHPDFFAKYARAKTIQAEFLADEAIEIADDGLNDTYVDKEGNEKVNSDHIARSRLRVDTRKWYASKVAPKRWGEKIMQEVTGTDGGPIEVSTDWSKLSTEEREAVRAALAKVAGGT